MIGGFAGRANNNAMGDGCFGGGLGATILVSGGARDKRREGTADSR